MSLQDIVNFADRANRVVGRYKIDFTLAPKKLSRPTYCLSSLSWSFIDYGLADIEKVPNNKRGIYAFVASQIGNVMPPHGYVMYIGIAGRDSQRSLRARYRDYLNDKTVNKRPHIALMIGTWHSVLKFYFAPIDANVSADLLKRIELELNSALMPPFSRGDLEASTKRMRRAFP